MRQRNFKVVMNPRPAGIDGGNRKPVSQITDRAKRYRAQKNAPPGPRQCVFCGSRRNVGVHHVDGNEDHGHRKNLAWACKSCNAKIAAAMKKAGKGKRTRQFNAGRVPSFKQYAWAVANHIRGRYDEAGAVIHATPPAVRSKYAKMIVIQKSKHGTLGKHYSDEVPF